jgi:fused signal recognition particle receptor
MKGFLQKFREGLRKTTPTFHAAFGKAGKLFGGRQLDSGSIESLEEALFGADFGVETTTEIMDEIRAAYRRDKSLRGKQAAEIGSRVLSGILEGSEGRLSAVDGEEPQVICLLGVNGAGKTTTAAKLAYRLKEDGDTVLLAACDTFRAAANEQIRSWSERLDLPLVASHHGADAAAVAFDAWQAARTRGSRRLIIDTAGRLHTKSNLMEELRKIRRVLQKQDATAPQHAWLVVDGSLGSNSIEQARVFHRDFGLTGLVVTKLDGTSRGGALAGIFRELKLPIFYVGLGESPEDLVPFSVDDYSRAIFGLEEAS